MNVDQDRLRRDIEANAEFGALDVDEGHGRTVLTGSKADQQARERFVNELRAAGFDVRVDAVGNIAGRWHPEGVPADAAPVALGSHLDSVPQGGIFDGPLGTYGALEAVRTINESERDPERPLEVVCFTEEEGGRFGVGTLGSSVVTDHRSAVTALALEDDEGVTLEERLADINFNGDDEINASKWHAWAELHIEQGTNLEDTNTDIGIVESITGLTNCEVEIVGEADHAGSTPMDARADAFAAAAEFVGDVERAAQEIAAESTTAVATIGEQTIEPNARNIIPGRVVMQMDVRDVRHDTMDEIVDRSQKSLRRLAQSRPVEMSIERYRDDPPSQMSDQCIEAAGAAVEATGANALRMNSAAMHDTANVADVTDAVLLFSPSRDGVSHNPREWTDWSDCATASSVLGETVMLLAESDDRVVTE